MPISNSNNAARLRGFWLVDVKYDYARSGCNLLENIQNHKESESDILNAGSSGFQGKTEKAVKRFN